MSMIPTILQYEGRNDLWGTQTAQILRVLLFSNLAFFGIQGKMIHSQGAGLRGRWLTFCLSFLCPATCRRHAQFSSWEIAWDFIRFSSALFRQWSFAFAFLCEQRGFYKRNWLRCKLTAPMSIASRTDGNHTFWRSSMSQTNEIL